MELSVMPALYVEQDFSRFRELPLDLQKEALREAELRLNAQLSIAADADRRALTWSGFLLTAATALVGAGFGAFGIGQDDRNLALLALLAGAGLLLAAYLSLRTVSPKEFHLPGNRPGLWLPSEWACSGSEARKVAQAREDQARCLDKAISENMEQATLLARSMHASFGIAIFTVFAGSIVLLLTIVG